MTMILAFTFEMKLLSEAVKSIIFLMTATVMMITLLTALMIAHTIQRKRLMIKHIDNRSDWIAARKNGIGASEAAAVIGFSPYKTNIELWREKTGKVIAADISDKPYIQYGKAAEYHIRELFKLSAADRYTVDYAEFDMHINDKYPFIFATLDGILTDKDGRKGILEVKTT